MTREQWLEILPWRNDPSVYVWNKTNRVIEAEEHLVWYEKRKSYLDREPLFAYFDGKFLVGMSRLDLTSPHTYEVGLIVNPRFRGSGYGKAILRDTCTFLSDTRYVNFDILAYIHVENLFSRNLFESCGFVKESQIGCFEVLKWVRTNA